MRRIHKEMRINKGKKRISWNILFHVNFLKSQKKSGCHKREITKEPSEFRRFMEISVEGTSLSLSFTLEIWGTIPVGPTLHATLFPFWYV